MKWPATHEISNETQNTEVEKSTRKKEEKNGKRQIYTALEQIFCLLFFSLFVFFRWWVYSERNERKGQKEYDEYVLRTPRDTKAINIPKTRDIKLR